jgi:hypothetical protein
MAATINNVLTPETLELRQRLGTGTNLHGKVDTANTNITAIKALTDNLPLNTASVLTDIEGASFSSATDSLHQLKLRADTLDSTLSSIEGTSFASGTDSLHALQVSLTAAKSDITAIKTKTDNLPANTDTVLSTIDTVVDAIKAVTDLLPDAGALTSLAQDSTVAKAAALSTAQSAITAIKAVTDLLPNAGALTSLAQDSTVAKDANRARNGIYQ